jgi:hypothetical protein
VAVALEDQTVKRVLVVQVLLLFDTQIQKQLQLVLV